MPTLVSQPNGPACWRYEYRPVPADSPPPDISYTGSTPDYTGSAPIVECPPELRNPQVDAAALAVRAWHEVPLPRPKPSIAPGWAITGKLAYLETRNQTSFDFTKPTDVGQLTIHATGTYTVDWGDGEHSWRYSVEGKPWPDGQITHQYIDVGAYNVVVTEHWTATWRIGPWSGTLDELRTEGRIDTFPVQQLQAVILR